jgi:hypothetical protein
MATAIVSKVIEQFGGGLSASITSPSNPVTEDTIRSDFVMTDNGFRHKSEIPADDDDDWFRKAGW